MPDAEVDYLALDVYLRGNPKVKYDTLPRYTVLESTDELLGPGGGSFSIHVDDPKLVSDLGNIFKHKNVFKVRRNGTNVGAFLLQTRELTAADSDEVASRIWQVSGEGLRGWFRDAVVQPENGTLKQYTPDNRAFNFSCINKSRWYNNSTWVTPTNIAKIKATASPYSTKPADWPDAPSAYWVWGPNSGASAVASQMGEIEDAEDLVTDVDNELAFIHRLDNVTKPNLTTIRKAYNDLGGILDDLSAKAAKVILVTSGDSKTAWQKVKTLADTASSKCGTADNSNSTVAQRNAAITATSAAITAGNNANGTTVAGPAMPAGDCYFRCEFTAAATGNYTFYVAANNTIDAYIDGQLVLSMPDEADTYDSVQTQTQELDAGPHVFAVKVTNTTKSIAGLIAAVYKEGVDATGDDAAIPAQLLNYTGDSSWKVCAYPAVAPGWTPGEIMLQLLSEAQARGVLFPTYVTPTFTEDVDSAGVPWLRSGDFSFSIGTEYFDVLSALESAGGDATIDPDTYAFGIYGVRGTNRSGINLTTYATDPAQLNPVVLRIGKNLLSADNTVTGQIKNTLLVQTSDGWSTATSGVDPELGVIEASYQSDQKASASNVIAQDALQQFSTPETSASYGMVPLSDLVPGRDFGTGDYVQAPGDDFVQSARRVSSISYQADADSGIATYALEFDTIQQDRLTILERRLDKLTSTGTSVGSSLTSTTSVNLPTTVSSGTPGSPIPTINAPSNLTGETNAYFTTDGLPESSVSLAWDPVVSGTDGSIATNVAYYEVWGGQTGSTIGSIATTHNTNYLVMDLDLDVDYTFRVRARQSDGPNFSAFSNDYEVVTAIPTDQLDKPTPPSVMSKLGVFTVMWDGNLVSDDGSTHGADARLSQVRLLVGSLQDMSDGAYVGQPLSAQGSTVIPNLTVGNTYYFRFTAVDTFGLVSQPSDIVTGILQGIELSDMDPAVGSIIQGGTTILYQPTPPGPANQNATTTWYDTAHGYKPYRWNTLGDNAWDPITYGLQDDGSGTAVYSYIQTGAIAANAVTALQIQTRAVTADKIDVGAIQAEHIQLGNYIPSGYGTNRVPGPLLDNANWTSKWNAITAQNLPPENVQYTDEGVLLSSSSTARALWSATPQQLVPASGRVVIDWIANSDATQLWIRLNTATSGGPWWQAVDLNGQYQNSAFGHFTMDFSQYSTFTGRTDGPVTSYAVYMVVPAGGGTSLIKALSVTELDPALTDLESVQITQAGIFMYNTDGSASMSISVGSKNFFAYDNQDGGAVSLDRNGNGAFSMNVSAQQVYGSTQVGIDSDGTYMSDGEMVLGGIDLLGTMDDLGTYFGYVETVGGTQTPWLDRLARNVIYRGYWNMPDGSNHYQINGQYQRFGSGYFVLQPGRQYMIMVNNGSLQIGTSDAQVMSHNIYFDLMFELNSLSAVVTSGVRAMRAVVYDDTSAQGNWTHPPITVAAVAGASLTAQNLTVGVIPAGVPIYWQYGSSQSGVPSAVVNVSSFGSGQSVTVIDQGPAFTNYFSAINAADSAMTGPASGQSASSGSGSTSSGTSSGQTKKTVTATKTVNASWSRSWNQSGSGIVSGSGTYTDANMMYMGYGASSMGSMCGFPALGLPSGATVTKVQVYLRNRHFYFNSGATAHIGHHGQSSVPSSFSSADKTSYSWAYGDGKWVTLPSAWNSSWASGSYRGISLGIDTTSSEYGYFDGNGKSDEPRLKVTYTYKA